MTNDQLNKPVEWFTCEYFDPDAGINYPMDYPDEGGWRVVDWSDGSRDGAEVAMKFYQDRYDVRLVRNVREVVLEVKRDQ